MTDIEVFSVTDLEPSFGPQSGGKKFPHIVQPSFLLQKILEFRHDTNSTDYGGNKYHCNQILFDSPKLKCA